jgi:hypothetical protein
MLNILILVIVLVVVITIILLNKNNEPFTQCSGSSISLIQNKHSPVKQYLSDKNQEDLIKQINKSIEQNMNNGFKANKPSCPTIPSQTLPPLLDCPACVCPKVVINTSDLQECNSNCPPVEPCPVKVCPRPVPHECPNTDCTYLGIKGIEKPDELFNVISDMLKNNKCTKQTLVAGINSIFENHSESPEF